MNTLELLPPPPDAPAGWAPSYRMALPPGGILDAVRIGPTATPHGRVLAYAAVHLAAGVLIHGVRVLRLPRGGRLHVAMPNRKVNRRCRQCGHPTPQVDRFCGQCGERVGDGSVDPGRTPTEDVVHATNEATRLEIERAVLAAYHALLRQERGGATA